jgi:enterochelin esterase-like enzyme
VPVVYFADGQYVASYAPLVDTAITAGTLPAVALVGVWVGEGAPGGGPATGPANDLRMIEYFPGVEALPGADSAFIVARYRGHYRFFTEEVRQWAESALGVSRERRWRAVQGSSSGASYALRLGRELPERYGLVIANSGGGADALMGPAAGWAAAPRHYLAAGVMEPPGLARTLRAVGDSLAAHGMSAVVAVYPGGHDALVWNESLVGALRWWLRP